MATRIGVDIGGTFTDLVYYDEATGETSEGKVLTVPNAPEEGVIEGGARAFRTPVTGHRRVGTAFGLCPPYQRWRKARRYFATGELDDARGGPARQAAQDRGAVCRRGD